MCTGSVCTALDQARASNSTAITDCECSDAEESCEICCLIDDVCVSTIAIAADPDNPFRELLPGQMGRHHIVGFPCGNFTGYCDFFNRCMLVDSEGALSRLANLVFESDTFNDVADFVEDMPWAVPVVVVGVIVIMLVMVVTVHFLLPRPEHVKERAERRKTIRRARKLQPTGGGEMRMY